MKIKNLMERAGILNEGSAAAIMEDFTTELEGLIDMAASHTRNAPTDITKDKRFYDLPDDLLSLKGVNIKNHENSEGEYRSVQRLLTPPESLDPNET